MKALAPLLCALWAGPLAAQEPSSAPLRPITLEEAFRLALARSETIAQSEASVRQALGRVDELRSAVLPHINLIGTQTYQESPNTPIPSFNNTMIPQYQITLTQPLFSGFREFLAFKQGRRQAESARLTEQRAEALLFQDVAQAYLNVLQSFNEIDIRRSIVGETRDRIGQLERWVRIGRSRDSETLAAKSLLAQTEAQVELARGQWSVAEELLRFLTGIEDGDFAPRPLQEPTGGQLDAYLAAARRRDDVEARRKDLEAAEFNTKIVWRQRFPQVGLTADYYLKRIGITGNIHYDAILGLNMPLFEGGQISAQVEQAQAVQDSAAQALSLAARAAERDVRSSHRSLSWALASVRALEKAAELASANLRAQERDYKLSLVSNLQVLDSLNALQTTELQLNAARQQAAMAGVQLGVAAGSPLPSKS